MRDDGGGGSSSNGTPWYMMSIEDMWQWVNRDLSPHYQQANSWKKTSELYGLYQSRLQAFRDKLAIAWNPKNSKAAEAYLTRLDELIKAVKDVDEVAGRNYQAAVDIPNAIAEAKYKLKPIYDKYKAAAGDFTKAGGSSTAGSYASTSSSSSEDAKKSADIVNQQHYAAQSVMYTLSSDLSASRTGLGKPAPYAAPQRTDGGSEIGGDRNSLPPPVIPPVVPSPPPNYPNMPPGPTQPMPQPKSPDLQGLQPVQPTPTQPPPFPTQPPTPTGTPPVGTPPPGGVIKPPPVPPGPGGAGVIKPPPGGRPPGPVPTGIGGPPRPGLSTGLIGGAPPAGGGRGVPGGARPNPVGGMIGGASAGAGRGGVGAPGAAGAGVGGRGTAAGRGAMGAMGIGGRPGQAHDEDGEHFDPDTAWDVAQGGAPVLDAPEAQRPIDPGPAIGLSR